MARAKKKAAKPANPLDIPLQELHKSTGVLVNLSKEKDGERMILLAMFSVASDAIKDVAELDSKLANIGLELKLGGIRIECFLDPKKHEQAVERAALLEEAAKK